MTNKILKTLTSLFLLSCFVLIVSLLSAKTSADTPTPTPAGPAASQFKRMLAPKLTSIGTYELSGSGLAPNYETYIMNCLPTKEGEKCTTGNTEYDGPTKLGIGGVPLQVKFVDGGDAKRITDATGKVQVTVKFIVSQSLGNVFYGVQINPPSIVNEGEGNSLQYGTYEFDPAILPIDFRADPKGRIFDSQSLEPISGVTVRILDQLNPEHLADAKLPDGTQANIIKVEADGQFNFMVNQGTYYLKLDPASHPNHQLTANPNLNLNYTKAYAGPTENCYQEKGKTHQTCAKLYTPQANGDPEAINENPPDEKERDIPLDPGSNAPYKSEPVEMTASNFVSGLNIIYRGKVSHPFTLVKLIGKTSAGVYGEQNADKYGSWTITVEQSKFIQPEEIELVYQKVDLTQNQPISERSGLFLSAVNFIKSIFKINVSAQTKNTVFQPIPRYLEGYAYDSAGKIIPNAKVAIILEMSPSKAIYYQTTADDNGLFKVNPNNIPTFSFYLQFTKPGSTLPIKMTTSEFAQKNAQYLETNKINLMTAKRGNESLIIAGRPTAPTTGQPPPAGETTLPQTPLITITPEPSNNSAAIVILLFVFGLAGLIAAVYFYLKKKGETSLPPMP